MNPLLKQAIADDLPDVVVGLAAQHPRWVNTPERDGQTPLFVAVTTYNRSIGCIRALLEAGADVNARLDSFTVLHWAMAELGHWHNPMSAGPDEVFPLLVEAGADLEAVDKYGFTPLMKAIIESALGAARTLLDVGADPNKTVPPGGRTAFNQGQNLLALSWFNHDPIAVIEMLLDAGADAAMRDAFGRTARDYFEAIDIEAYLKYENLQSYGEIRLRCIERLRQTEEQAERRNEN